MFHLFGDLAEVVDEADGGGLLERVVDVVDVHLALVKEVVEHVDRLHGRRTLLLVAEDQVDPLVQVGAHVVTLQGLWTERGFRFSPKPRKRSSWPGLHLMGREVKSFAAVAYCTRTTEKPLYSRGVQHNLGPSN